MNHRAIASRFVAAETVFLFIRSTDGLAFYLMGTIFSVYLVVETGLNPFQLVMLGTILEGTILVFEIPTGTLADSLGRKPSVVVGYALLGAGVTLMGLVRSFLPLAVTQVACGIGFTCISGAEIAWIVDEVGEGSTGRLLLRGKQFENAFGFAGIAVSVGLAAVHLALPLIAAGVIYLVLAVFLAVAMREEGFVATRTRAREIHRSMLSTFDDGIGAVRTHRVLIIILAVTFVHGMATEGFDRLVDLHLIRNIGLPSIGELDRVVWFGIITAVGLFIAIGVTEIVKRHHDVTTVRGATAVLVVADVGIIVAVSVLGLTGNFALALGCIWTVSVMRNIREPVMRSWLNQDLDPAPRATVNSIASQTDAVGEMAAGPVVGLLALWRSVQSALVFAGLIKLPTLALLGSARRDPARLDVHAEPTTHPHSPEQDGPRR